MHLLLDFLPLQVQEGLAAGRRWLWDEASRKIGILLSAPSAFEGEHFQQVSCLKFLCMGTLSAAGAVPPGLHSLQASLLVSPLGICCMTSGAEFWS